MNEMSGKVILLTGGGGGVARGVANAFAEQGGNLILTDVVQEGMDRTKSEIESKYGTKVVTCIANGGKEDEVKNAITKGISKFGKLDVLINCAQVSKSGLTLVEHSKEDFDLAIYSGLYATFFYMKHSLAYLKETKGSVINFASGAGIGGNPGQSSYAAAKEGIRGLSRVAANEWGEYGITVNCVCPLVMTPALEKWKKESPEMYKKNVGAIPLGHFGDAKNDVGGVCVFLSSNASKYITGETFNVQGGLGMRP